MKLKNTLVMIILFAITIGMGYYIVTQLKMEEDEIDLLELDQLDLSTKEKRKAFVKKAEKAGASNLQAKTLSILIANGSNATTRIMSKFLTCLI